MTAVVKRDYIDATGIPRRVFIPEDETDNSIGIPLSLDLDSLFGHMPLQFQRDLYQALHAQGLVEAKDYLAPGAGDRFRAAMLSVIKHDFFRIQTLVKQEIHHD